MTMTAQGLADAMTAAQGPAEVPADQQQANLAIATGIINYLIAHATVTVPAGVAVTTSSGAGSTSAAGIGTIS